ncbi:SLBB domain-containing protein [Parapedobacter lycopersici]|uniref:SLBB domain-containing protein n=1 Tax=Parapedobacter lycopersici TaxID=1864939 RepID=UPI0033422E81
MFSTMGLRFIGLIVVFVVGLGLPSVWAQTINPDDLSTVRVDELSDAQIQTYLQQAQASGLSEAEMEQMALQRGMPVEEVEKLRKRIERIQGGQGSTSNQPPAPIDRPVVNREVSDSSSLTNKVATDSLPDDSISAGSLEIFGSSLFEGQTARFEPNLRMATPSNYVIGPDDQVLIDIYGKSEAFHNLTVTPEGNIVIPYVGVVAVNGLTMEAAAARIEQRMAMVYPAIKTGDTRILVSLGNVRTIKIVITGEVKTPGTYSLPSVATVFNALYLSGGPTARGSFRDIRLIRGGKEIATLDIYDVLMNGAFADNVGLRDQDILMVPPYQRRVELRGEVKRPAIFELKPTETFEDLLRYAGGFTEEAYRERVKVTRNTATEKRIEDLLASQMGQFEPQSGDQYIVGRILDRYANRVTINGAVFRPGVYELSSGLTLSMLIKKAEGVKEDAFLNRGYILRLQDDLQTEQIAFNVAAILAGTEPDVELKREDVIRISSIFDLKEEFSVRIDGEVRNPGIFDYAAGMTLQDLIMQAGGFRESASTKRIEVSRRMKNADALSIAAQTAEIFQVNINRTLDDEANFELMPFDIVVVRTEAGYETQKTVQIEGEVLYPGRYTITKKNERISDLVKRAGGFTPFAYIEGASLKRAGNITQKMAETERERSEKTLKQQDEYERMVALRYLQQNTNSINELHLSRNLNNDFVGINLERIIQKPGTRGDLILEDGDVIRVPKELQTVEVSGEVLAPSTAIYAPNKGFKQYINQAGGFSQRALRKNAYIIYANGSVKSTNRFLFFNNYPPVKPGAEIFVPQAPERLRMGPQQWLGFSTGLASLVAIIVTIVR